VILVLLAKMVLMEQQALLAYRELPDRKGTPGLNGDQPQAMDLSRALSKGHGRIERPYGNDFNQGHALRR